VYYLILLIKRGQVIILKGYACVNPKIACDGLTCDRPSGVMPKAIAILSCARGNFSFSVFHIACHLTKERFSGSQHLFTKLLRIFNHTDTPTILGVII
jgi:hypothetical protein